MIDDEGRVGQQKVWAGGRGRWRGAPGVAIAVAVVVVPIFAVTLVVVAVLVPIRGGVGVRCVGSGGRGGVRCFVPGDS